MKYVAKLIIVTILALSAACLSVAQASAHRDGCHRWHSCPSDTGSYVCGDLGYYSECPSAAPAAPAPVAAPPAPQVPVVTKKSIVENVDIPYAKKTQVTYKEYKGYKKSLQAGVTGKVRKQTEIAFSDAKETGRSVLNEQVLVPTVDETTVIGGRIAPLAKITMIKQTKNKGKFDVYGQFAPRSTVVLSLDGKKIQRAKTDDRGGFMFKQVRLSENRSELIVFKRVKNKENQISEKTFANVSMRFVTEYDMLHGKKL